MDREVDLLQQIEALRERLSRLSEAGLRINESLDFDTVLQEVLDSARALTRARYGVITLLDESGRVRDFLSSGMTPEEAEGVWGHGSAGIGDLQPPQQFSGAAAAPGAARAHQVYGPSESQPAHAGGFRHPVPGSAGLPPGRALRQHLPGPSENAVTSSPGKTRRPCRCSPPRRRWS